MRCLIRTSSVRMQAVAYGCDPPHNLIEKHKKTRTKLLVSICTGFLLYYDSVILVQRRTYRLRTVRHEHIDIPRSVMTERQAYSS